MMEFLDRILATKRREVAQLHTRYPYGMEMNHLPPTRGFAKSIREATGLAVIAEIKQASPSKGLIAKGFNPELQARIYAQSGANAISVLTDHTYFQGSIQDLALVRRTVDVPILRKDFLIDELQIAEARQSGADAVLLIVAAMAADRLVKLSRYAKSIGLDVLVEVHAIAELEAAMKAEPSVLGVNNRDLHTFEVDLDTTRQVLERVPKGQLAIAESGVHSDSDAAKMKQFGANGILVGESLMRESSPDAIRRRVHSFKTAGTSLIEDGASR